MIPLERYYEVVPQSMQSPVPWEMLTQLGPVLHWALLLSFLAIGFGWFGRLMTSLVFIFHLAFMFRNPFILYGVDGVVTCWLFSLCWMQTHPTFRFPFPWQWLQKNTWRQWFFSYVRAKDKSDAWTNVGTRLIQVQLCVIYFYSGIGKLKGMSWWEGNALMKALSNHQYVTINLEFLSHFPVLLSVMGFVTILWEIYFPVLVWLPQWKKWVLVFGCLLHVGIAVFMNLYFFSLFMMMSYLLFFSKKKNDSTATGLRA